MKKASCLRLAGLMMAVFGLAVTAQAEDGVMMYGKIKLQGPAANDANVPDEPYVSGQSYHRGNPSGPLRIKAVVKDAQGNPVEARLDIRGSMDEIKKNKTFQIYKYQDQPGKAYLNFHRAGSYLDCGATAGTVTFTALGDEGQTISGNFTGVKWATGECQQALSGSGSFKVTRNQDY